MGNPIEKPNLSSKDTGLKPDSSFYSQLGIRSLAQSIKDDVTVAENSTKNTAQDLSQKAGIEFSQIRQIGSNEFNKFDYWYTNTLLNDARSGNFGLPTISAISYPEISYPLILHRLYSHINKALQKVNESIGAH